MNTIILTLTSKPELSSSELYAIIRNPHGNKQE